ncbi:MAG: GtrA family protein [Elusimicrobiaceae bacterium]|nr:GtrA family protein [Elusimicrobiaceae bacterium]
MQLFQKFCCWIAKIVHLPEQIIRFLIIGGVNTVFAYCIYALSIFLGAHYTLAVLLSTVIGTCFSFKTMGTMVFDNPDNMLIFKFIAVYTGCYFLNVGILRLLTLAGVRNLYVAGITSMLLVSAVSFCLNKWVVFRKKDKIDQTCPNTH